MRASVNVNGTDITVISKGDDNDCISFTDIARYKNPVWEQLNNPDFNEFDSFKHEAGSNAFTLNIPRYVDTFEEEVEIDIDAVQVEIDGRRA